MSGRYVRPSARQGEVGKSYEAALVRRARAGSSLALGELLQRAMPLAYPTVGALLSDPHAVNDVLQEAATCAIEQLDAYRPSESAFSTWFCTIARNKAVDRLRTKDQAEPMEPAAIGAAERHDRSHFVEERYFDAEFSLTEIVQALPEFQRKTVFMRFAGGFTHKEIAATLDRSLGSVRQAEHRGLQTLRQRVRAVENQSRTARVERNPMARRPRFSPVLTARRAFAF